MQYEPKAKIRGLPARGLSDRNPSQASRCETGDSLLWSSAHIPQLGFIVFHSLSG